jgi:8-oxo-dGTP diphosphatase
VQPLQIVSTVVIVKSKGRFLLVRRAEDDDIFPNKWQNPGGKVELGERLEETSRRELQEETGIEVEGPFHFIMSYSWQKDNDAPVRLGVIFLHNIERDPADLSITLCPELCDYGWFTLEEARKLDLIGKDSPTGTFAQLEKALTL